MSVSDPKILNEHYNDLFREGDLDELVALYEPDAVLCPAPAQELRGHDQIRKQLEELIKLEGELTATQLSCVDAGDLALLHANWSFKGAGSSGKPVEMGGYSSKLARKGADGNWRYVIDMPVATQT